MERQDVRYEFDGFEPVAMVTNTINHVQIAQNIYFALRTRLQGSPCRVLGPDVGVATLGDAIRFPDALVMCAQARGTDRLVPGVVVMFEVLSPSSGGRDRITKLVEYVAVPSIRRSVILESEGIGAAVFARAEADAAWTATALTADDTLGMPEIGIRVPITDLYDGVDLSGPGDA